MVNFIVFAQAEDTSWVIHAMRLLSIPVLVGLNGLFVAAEFALVAVRKTRIEQLHNEGVKGTQAVQLAIDNLDRSIAATQLGITLASIALGFVGEPALAHIVEPLFTSFSSTWQGVATHSIAVGISFFIITFLHVVFGELIPKTVALQVPDRTALWIARPLLIFTWLTRPLIMAMNGTGNWILRLCGYRTAPQETLVHSVEELRLLIEDTQEAGILASDHAEYAQNVLMLPNKTVGDCMVSREEMASLELRMTPEVILDEVRQGGHTRLPVYEEKLDNIVGIVNTKDLFYLYSLSNVVVLEDALYPALFLKPEEPISNALRLFRKSHRQMALVRDESQTILGLLTLEDVLEKIVGEIEDEHDSPTARHKMLKSNSR